MQNPFDATEELPDGNSSSAFADLFPHLSPEERRAAEARFDRYIQLALRVYERLLRDPQGRETLERLTAKSLSGTKEERSS